MMEKNELLKLGFTCEQQYLQAKEVAEGNDYLPHGAFISRDNAYSFSPRDSIDNLDYSRASFSNSDKYPYTYDLTSKMSKVFNQGERGTCVAQAVTALLEYYFDNKYKFSQQFLYWLIKRTDGSEKKLREWLSSPKPREFPDYLNFVNNISSDSSENFSAKDSIEFHKEMKDKYRNSFSGALLSSAKSVLEKYGICEYDYMPYVPNDIFLTEAQSPEINDENLLMDTMRDAMINAHSHKIKDKIQLLSGRSVDTYKAAISGAGDKRPMPVVFSVSVFRSWATEYVKQTGWLSSPLKGEKSKGGHSMLAVGYKDTPLSPGGGYLIVRNSWGSSWSWDYKYKGYARIPYSYIEHYADATALSIISAKKEEIPSTLSVKDMLEKYIRVASKDMKNRKGRYAISKGQEIIVDATSGIADVCNDDNCREFINKGYTWE